MAREMALTISLESYSDTEHIALPEIKVSRTLVGISSQNAVYLGYEFSSVYIVKPLVIAIAF